MRRVIAIVATGASLAGCSSFSLDALRPTPQPIQVQLESVPPGADARTSLGPGCRTPCSISLPPPETSFSVTYTLNKYQSTTVPVQVNRIPGDFTTAASASLDPNPVVAELQPIGPPPKVKPVRKMLRPKKPKPPKANAAAPAAESAFPEPAAAPAAAAPPPTTPSR